MSFSTCWTRRSDDGLEAPRVSSHQLSTISSTMSPGKGTVLCTLDAPLSLRDSKSFSTYGVDNFIWTREHHLDQRASSGPDIIIWTRHHLNKIALSGPDVIIRTGRRHHPHQTSSSGPSASLFLILSLNPTGQGKWLQLLLGFCLLTGSVFSQVLGLSYVNN